MLLAIGTSTEEGILDMEIVLQGYSCVLLIVSVVVSCAMDTNETRFIIEIHVLVLSSLSLGG
jgi:hypothetical protein